MESSPASSSRPRDPGLFGSFDLPASWGCRKSLAFCRDLGALGYEGNAAAAAAAEPKRNSRSPPKVYEEQHAPVAAAAAAAPAQEAPRKRWNLRDRKSGRDSREDAQQNKKPCNMDDGGGRTGRGFSVALTKQEIDADFFAITGQKAQRKPAKRAKSIQRQIDSLCPGNLLREMTRDRYKVNKKGGF
ncbi:hypothetical protein GUJ93_ZPchr0010g10885 [Zizania palustris]|uniref:Uncharacterized protein n=1 Tax=Zizania palustris TaxID=103762 RepID=A0A8J6BP16_ZIZPA|nr:hypothetical protein GUJ93_ZPchr0010g10885 [Zizania palustris]